MPKYPVSRTSKIQLALFPASKKSMANSQLEMDAWISDFAFVNKQRPALLAKHIT